MTVHHGNKGKGTDCRREHDLLLLCARSRAEEGIKQHIRELLRAGIDFDYLIQLAQRHLILPLLFHQLNRSAPDLTPPLYLQKLKSHFRDNAARNIYYAAELRRILGTFEERGIEAVPFKGPMLARLAYGDLSLRRFIDLDILVRRHDIRRAKELLISQGYELQPRISPAQEAVLLREQHALQLVREGGYLIVELHWSIVPKRFAHSVQAEDLWGRVVKIGVDGAEVRSLPTEDLLLGLCAHGTKHLWERLIWICDVAELLNSSPALDWAMVLERARAAGLERMVFLGLRLAGELLGAPLPAEVIGQAVGDSAVGDLVSFVRARLFDGAVYKQAGMVQNIRFNLRARSRRRDRLRYCGFILSPTDGDIAALRVPAGLSFVYYLLRPFRLLAKGDEHH